MISKKTDRNVITEIGAENGEGILKLDKLIQKPNAPEKLQMYAQANLEPGASVGYHVHNGESEIYYILSGTGDYDDNGTVYKVNAGDATYTKSGEGHGIKNTSNEPLVFMALIIKD